MWRASLGDGTLSPLVMSLSRACQKVHLLTQYILTILVVAIFYKNTPLTTNIPFSLRYIPVKRYGTVTNLDAMKIAWL